MVIFWTLVGITFALVGSIMGWLAFAARDVPDRSELEPGPRRRLNPDQLRMLAYAVMVLLCLLAAMYEAYHFYGTNPEPAPSHEGLSQPAPSTAGASLDARGT